MKAYWHSSRGERPDSLWAPWSPSSPHPDLSRVFAAPSCPGPPSGCREWTNDPTDPGCLMGKRGTRSPPVAGVTMVDPLGLRVAVIPWVASRAMRRTNQKMGSGSAGPMDVGALAKSDQRAMPVVSNVSRSGLHSVHGCDGRSTCIVHPDDSCSSLAYLRHGGCPRMA